ncbi:unnamed protein product [Lathyrus sativus]|nr:unnamed protein product [Lathyrus sativus]
MSHLRLLVIASFYCLHLSYTPWRLLTMLHQNSGRCYCTDAVMFYLACSTSSSYMFVKSLVVCKLCSVLFFCNMWNLLDLLR